MAIQNGLQLGDKLQGIKNVSGGPLPLHSPPCDPREFGLSQGAQYAHCPLDAIPQFDGTFYPFATGEEMLLPVNAAKFLVNAWKGKLNFHGPEIGLLSLLKNPSSLYDLTENGKVVRRIEIPQPRPEVPQQIEQVGGRRVTEMTDNG